jgi:hypothetical protein
MAGAPVLSGERRLSKKSFHFQIVRAAFDEPRTVLWHGKAKSTKARAIQKLFQK